MHRKHKFSYKSSIDAKMEIFTAEYSQNMKLAAQCYLWWALKCNNCNQLCFAVTQNANEAYLLSPWCQMQSSTIFRTCIWSLHSKIHTCHVQQMKFTLHLITEYSNWFLHFLLHKLGNHSIPQNLLSQGPKKRLGTFITPCFYGFCWSHPIISQKMFQQLHLWVSNFPALFKVVTWLMNTSNQ